MKKLFLILLSSMAITAHALTIKVAVLAPEGTSWAKNLKMMAKEIKTATNREVKLKVYYGGSQGDEPDVLRKIRIGQLHGGFFSGKTLGDINGDVRTMEVPFTFHSDQKKAWLTLQKMTPYFNNGFKKHGFKNLGFFGLGLVYLVSKTKIDSAEQLKGKKIWSWSGDPLVETLVQSMNLVSVPLPLPDVLSSLSNGIVEAAYSPPLAIVSLQWHTKIKYLIDFPITYSIGAFLIDEKTWVKIPGKYQQIMKKISAKYCNLVNEANMRENIDALNILKAQGVEFLTFPQKDYNYVKGFRSKMIKQLEGKLFSSEAIGKVQKFVKGV